MELILIGQILTNEISWGSIIRLFPIHQVLLVDIFYFIIVYFKRHILGQIAVINALVNL